MAILIFDWDKTLSVEGIHMPRLQEDTGMRLEDVYVILGGHARIALLKSFF